MLQETADLQKWVHVIKHFKQMIYTERYFGAFLLPLFCVMMIDGRNECFIGMGWFYGIMLQI